MREGIAVIVMNMLVSELGYSIIWTIPTDRTQSESFRLENEQGDACEFSGDAKFEDAVEWLRQRH